MTGAKGSLPHENCAVRRTAARRCPCPTRLMSFLSTRRAGKALVLIAVIAGISWISAVPVLRTVGRTLVWDDPTRNADVIIVAGWDGDAGAVQAADLVRQGVAPLVAVVDEVPNPADRILMDRGIIAGGDRSWIVSLLHMLGVQHVEVVGVATGSESEAALVTRWCAARNVRVAVVVTTPDHSHRLRRVLTRTALADRTRFIVVPSRYSGFDPQIWWKTRGGVRIGVVELEKLALDFIRHPFN